jgi:sensor domain CHASE-containing protein
MTLRQKTVLIIGGTLAGLLILLYIILSLLTQQSYSQLEIEETEQHLDRARAAIDEGLAGLRVRASDWAAWDETYAFVAGDNPDYVRVNLTDQAIAQLQLNVMVFVDATGRLVHGQALDLRTGSAAPFPPSLRELVERDTPLTRHATPESAVTGLVMLPEGPLLVAARPILNSALQGPIRGTLIFGRYLDSDSLTQFSRLIQLPLGVAALDGPALPADFQTARQSLGGSTRVFTQPLSDGMLAGYTLLHDVFEQPALIVRVSAPRDITAQGRQTLQNMTLAVLVAGLVLGALMWWLLDRQILTRLAQLGRVFQSIQATGDLSQRVPIGGADEITALSRTSNALIEQLQASVATLQQREVERGRQLAAIAEMGRAAVTDLNLEPLLARAVELIRERFACEGVAIFLVEEDGQAALYETTQPQLRPKGSRLPVGTRTIAGQALAAGAPQLVRAADGTLRHAEDLPGTLVHAALPLRAGQRVIGVLDLQSKRREALTPTDVETLQILADQIAVAVENDRLFGQQKRVLHIEELTLALTSKIHQSLKPDTIMENAALELGRALGARRAVVKLFGEEPPPEANR